MAQIVREFKNGSIVTLKSAWPDKSCVEPEWENNRRTIYEDQDIWIWEIRDPASHDIVMQCQSAKSTIGGTWMY